MKPTEPIGGAGQDAETVSPHRGARALLDQYGLRPKKAWGQNFLHDAGVLAKIAGAAELSADDVAVEIGAGLGALTQVIAERAGRVIAVERDPDLVAVLRAEFGGGEKIAVMAEDALAVDFAALAAQAGRPLVVVGNLPYQITTPLLFRILHAAAAGQVVRHGVFMVQKEVAMRIVAGPGSKIYGRLSVMLQQLADVKVLFHVGKGAFIPPPSVTSTVFSLRPRAQPRAAVDAPALFEAVVRSAFAGRRKMLRRALGDPFGDERVNRALAAASIAGTVRGEELSVEELARVANALHAEGAIAPANRQDLDQEAESDDA